MVFFVFQNVIVWLQMSADDMQLGQTEVCTDSKSSVGMNNIRHNHTHSATHNHGHNHLHGVLIGTMQSYGNNLIESFKTEPLCQVQCMDCQKVCVFGILFLLFLSANEYSFLSFSNFNTLYTIYRFSRLYFQMVAVFQ